MKEIPRRLSSLRIWAALLLAVLLLCGCLTGCDRDGKKTNTLDMGASTVTPEDETDPQNPTQPKNHELTAEQLWTQFKAAVEALKTYNPDEHIGNDGKPISDPTPSYTGAVETLKTTVDAMLTTVPSKEALAPIIAIIEGLINQSLPDATKAATEKGIELSPTEGDLKRLLDAATKLQALLPEIDQPAPSDNGAIHGAQEAIQRDIQKGFQDLTADIHVQFDNLKKELPSGVSPLIVIIGFALCLVAIVVGIILIRAEVTQVASSVLQQAHSSLDKKTAQAVEHAKESAQTTRVVQFDADGMEVLKVHIAETKKLREQVEQLLKSKKDDRPAPGQTPPPQKLPMFVWDRQKGLNEVSVGGDFSGEPTGGLNEYRIWPDPRKQGAQSLYSQETINRNALYGGSVKEFFDIYPPTAANYNSYSIEVKECAVIQKDMGMHYCLVRKGQIQAKGLS